MLKIDNLLFFRCAGASVPEELRLKLLAAKNYRAASFTMRQLHFAYTDLWLHQPTLRAQYRNDPYV